MTAVMDDPAVIVAEQTKLATEYKTLARAFASSRQTRLQAQMKMLKRGRRNPLFTRLSKQQDDKYHAQCELISKRAEYAVACIRRVSQGERRSVWLQFHKDKNAAKMRMISQLNQQLAQIRREYCQYNLEQVKVEPDEAETKLPAVLFGKPAPATQQEAYHDLATIHAQHAHIEHQAQLERTEASFDQQDFELVHSLENLKYSIDDERERAEEASREHQREEARRAEEQRREVEQREREAQQHKLHQQQLRREEEARQAQAQLQAAQERAFEEDRREQQQREQQRQRELDYQRQHQRSLSGSHLPPQQQGVPQAMAASQGPWTNGAPPGRRTPQSLHSQLPPQMRHPSHSHSHSQIPPPPQAPGTPGSQKMFLPPPSSFQQAPPPPPPQGNFYPQYDKPMLPHPGQQQQQQQQQQPQQPPPPHMGQQQHPGHPQHHPGHPGHPAGASPPGPGQPPGAYSQQMPPQYYPPPPPHMGYPPQGYYPPREHQGPPPPLPPHMRPGIPQHQVYYNGSPQMYQVPPLQPPQYGRQLPPPPQWY
ncbi:hypothetical protein CJU89_2707 [Yarrowia sp. B02]|nr:hypothetical protein CJU89_2707 [Yarrowia sp. B02]